MRTSLYDAIGLSPGSSLAEIRAGLRALVRRFWSVPRDPSGDSEEALRFVSLAAAILTDEKRRDNYDASLSPGVGTGPWRIPTASARLSAIEDGDSQSPSDQEQLVSGLSVDAPKDLVLPSVEAFSENFPGESSRPLTWIVAASMFGILVALVGSLALAAQIAPGINLAAAIFGLLLLLATAIGAMTAQRAQQHQPGQSLSHLAVIKWRRDGSVFIGVPAPQQDTTWLFRLRLAELTRSNNGYLVQPAVWRRVMARAFDYSLVTLSLLILFEALAWLLPPDSSAATLVLGLLRSPLILPSLVVLAGIPLETWLTAKWRYTPGKWLLGLILISGVTHAGSLGSKAVRAAASARAWSVAAQGLSYGFLPLALSRLRTAIAAMRHDEPPWEAAADTVVLARPVAWLPAMSGALVGLATSVLVAALWWQDVQRFKPHLNNWVDQWSPPATPRLPVTLPEASVTRVESEAKPVEPIKPPPTPSAQPPRANDDVQRLAALAAAAQNRRARIERAEAAVAAVRRGQGSYAPLQSICQRWTEDQPGSAEAWRCLGLAQYQNGAGAAALPALRTALRLQPKDPEVEAAILGILRPQ